MKGSKDDCPSKAINADGVPFRREIKLRRTPKDRINLVASYKKMIEEGSFKTQAELARHFGVSRAWGH